jgi:hypothetical protein
MPSRVVQPGNVLTSDLEDYGWVEKECKLLQATHTVQSSFDALMRQKDRGASDGATPIKVELVDKDICALQR